MLTDLLTVAYISRLSTLLTWPEILNTVLCRYRSRFTTARLGQGIKASIGFQYMAGTPLWNVQNAPHQTSITIYTRCCLNLSRHQLSSVTFRLSDEGSILLERPVHSSLGTISKNLRSTCTSLVVSLTPRVPPTRTFHCLFPVVIL